MPRSLPFLPFGSLGLGALLALGLAPFHQAWLWVVVLSLYATHFADFTSKRRIFFLPVSFWHGYMFGGVYFLSSLYWIGLAPAVFSDDLRFLTPFASLGVSLIFACFWGLASMLAAQIARGHQRHLRIIALIGTLSFCEWLRGQAFSGFPWNMPVHILSDFAYLRQIIAIFGSYGSNVVVLFFCMVPALLWRASWRGRIIGGSISCMLFIGFLGFGVWRYQKEPAFFDHGVRLVQRAIAQRQKWDINFRDQNLSGHVVASIHNRPDWVNAVIWPEAASGFFLPNHPDLWGFVQAAAPKNGYLITGTLRFAPDRSQRNALMVFGKQGPHPVFYDKHHLVPFGEYIPFAYIFSQFKPLAGFRTGITAGPPPAPFHLPGLPAFLPLICYEIIFPELAQTKADWILNITNDAWFGTSTGPYQHAEIARMRAVETGSAVVRSANTGISAIYDGYGNVIDQLGINVRGVIDAKLPRPISVWRGQKFMLWLLLFLIFVILVKNSVR
ncbi:MAG: apolipoprotein N-acyltransferase, partial [Pseudomonadota bacterium]